MKPVFNCAVNLVTEYLSYDIEDDTNFWLFFENEEIAKKTVCNVEFGEKYEYPTKAIFCDIVQNSDGNYITASDFADNETYYFQY